MKEIYAIGYGDGIFFVDDNDYDWLNQYVWMIGNSGYAAIDELSEIFDDIAYHYMSMSHLILGLEAGNSRQADHINHNIKDNTRQNLRIVTVSQNQQNRKISEGGTSQYKGVCWNKKKKKWTAQIGINDRCKWLGCFSNEQHAAHAYNLAAKHYFGQYALLNKVVA